MKLELEYYSIVNRNGIQVDKKPLDELNEEERDKVLNKIKEFYKEHPKELYDLLEYFISTYSDEIYDGDVDGCYVETCIKEI